MLQYLSDDLCRFDIAAETPEEAIYAGVQPLIASGKVDKGYLDDILDGYREHGPYFVLVPHFAMPHARPSNKVHEVCLSFVKLAHPVIFGHSENDPVYYVMALAGTDSVSHLDLLKELMKFLSCDELAEELPQVNNYSQFSELLSKYLLD